MSNTMFISGKAIGRRKHFLRIGRFRSRQRGVTTVIFASSVAHGRQVVEVLKRDHQIECGFVCGETPADERDQLLASFRGDANDLFFKQQLLRYLFNVNFLTTGFDRY